MEKNPHKSFRPFDKVSFYVVAHADDWQLFMHPTVYNDLVSPACKVIFIITTSGDAGMGEKFWRVREEGSKSSVRFCLAPFSVFSESNGQSEFNDHTIHLWSVNNITTYFLRLPDGNLDGSGFAAYNFQSLSKFKSGQIDVITALDDSTTYPNWRDFTCTIESIISFESKGISNRWIHYLNPDPTANPGDHTDHAMTGNAIQDMTIITTLHQSLFMGYSVASVQESLTSNELFWKAGMFAVYEKAVYDLCGYSTLKEDAELYVKWCSSKATFLTILPASAHSAVNL
ncbi:MAG: hypothetical protein ABIN01_03245 [Ferruginibacter sp.]